MGNATPGREDDDARLHAVSQGACAECGKLRSEVERLRTLNRSLLAELEKRRSLPRDNRDRGPIVISFPPPAA
jgi:hypothetical protein